MLSPKYEELFLSMGYENLEQLFYSKWFDISARHEVYLLLETIEDIMDNPSKYPTEQVDAIKKFMAADLDTKKLITDYYLQLSEEANGNYDHIMSLLSNAEDKAGMDSFGSSMEGSCKDE